MPDRAARQNSRDEKPLVYVVDDERPMVALMEALLVQAGFEVVCFSEAASALKAYTNASRRPDVLVTDYAMGSVNGLQLIEACRLIEPRQKTFLVSGTVEEIVFRDSPVKPDHFLPKPFKSSELIGQVRKLLALK